MRYILGTVIYLLLSACAITAPPYQPSNDNGNLLQDISRKIAVDNFTSKNESVHSLSMRGSSLVSPYNASYSDYLTKALEEELKFAGLWDGSSNTRISGELIENDLTVPIGEGSAFVKARFIVKYNGSVQYEKILEANHKWESPFVGAVAIPRASENYSIAVQKLFSQLFSDSDFIRSLKME